MIATAPRPRLIACISVPAAKPGSDDLLDVDAIISFIQSEPPDEAFIERVAAMPSQDDGKGGPRRGMGATSAFNFGGAVYTLRTCVVGLGIKLTRIEPTAWKKAHGLSSKDPATGRKLEQREVKERSRQKAIALFGERFFPNVGHHNRAEAALIANYGAMLKR
ncbi:MAG TPA: hypothetical protein VIU44_05335 [Gaiellaceae bacterium]